MTCNLFGGSSETCGNMTSGGTESILLAIKVCGAERSASLTAVVGVPRLGRRPRHHPPQPRHAPHRPPGLPQGAPCMPALRALTCGRRASSSKSTLASSKSNALLTSLQPRVVNEITSTRTADVAAMASAINSNTIAIVGSAINVRCALNPGIAADL